MDDPVELKRESAVLTITINRAERRNALNEAVARGIAAGLDRAEADRSVRVVVLTGAGKDAFCAGGDMKPAADGARSGSTRPTRATTSPTCFDAWTPAGCR